MPVSTINPDDIFLFRGDVASKPMDRSSLAAMAWPHDDKTFPLKFLTHHFYLTIDGHKYLRIDIILTHLLHHRLHEIRGSSAPLILLALLPVLEFIRGFSGLRHYYITHSAKSPKAQNTTTSNKHSSRQ